MERYEPETTTDTRHEETGEPQREAAPPATDDTHAPEGPVAGEQQPNQGLDSPLGPRSEEGVEGRPAESQTAAPPEQSPGTAEGQPATATATPDEGQTSGSEPLLARDDTDQLTQRWESIQIGFVDEPRQAVQDADALVAEVIRRLSDSFSDERARLEGQWGRGEDVPTDELRLTLQRYRSFFHRLLST